ncbi:hypothetical protein [Microbacterium sp. P5_E9]
MIDFATAFTQLQHSGDPFWFQSGKGHSRHYLAWQDYLDDLDPNGDAAERLFHIAQRAGDGIPEANEEEPARRTWLRAAQQVPWATFVLGTGCLSFSDDDVNESFRDEAVRGVVTDEVPPSPEGAVLEQVRVALKDIDEKYPGLALSEIALDFFSRLVTEKLGPAALLSALPVRTPADWKLPARVVLAATLASRLYTAALDSSPHIIGRADRELVVADLDSWSGARIEAELREPLDHVLGLLSPAADPQAPNLRALKRLVSAVKESIRQTAPAIRRTHVELLTAFAWYFVTAGSTVYLGWAELMLFQAFDDERVFREQNDLPADHPSPRPAVRSVFSPHTWVHDRIESVTKRSWRERVSAGVNEQKSGRLGFYNLVAEIVRDQAASRSSLPSGDHEAPLPACFISSFDLELEMALWHKSVPFIIVLPTFAADRRATPQTASLRWVWAKITPPKSGDFGPELPSALMSPATWSLLSRASLEDESDPARQILSGTIPVIVRLTGSPLMDVPQSDELRKTAMTSAFHHALVLDEYTAIQQAAADLALTGLPPQLSGNRSTRGPQRFWMLLGTQLEDSGVRFRVMAPQVLNRLSPTQSTEHSAGEPRPGAGYRAGVLINEKSQTSYRELFFWHDLDAVDARHLSVMADLDGFAKRWRASIDALEALRPTPAPTHDDEELPD